MNRRGELIMAGKYQITGGTTYYREVNMIEQNNY